MMMVWIIIEAPIGGGVCHYSIALTTERHNT